MCHYKDNNIDNIIVFTITVIHLELRYTRKLCYKSEYRLLLIYPPILALFIILYSL